MFFQFYLFCFCLATLEHHISEHPSSILLELASECWFLEMLWMPSNSNWTAAFLFLCQNFLFWLKKEEKEKLKNKWHVSLEFQNQSRSLPQREGGGGEEELSGGVLVKVICGFKLSQYDDVLRIQLFNASSIGEIIPSSGGPCHLSTIPLKDSHLFKIAESVISFCFKKIYNSTILDKCKSFSETVEHLTCPPCEPYNFS